jgi:hypothetical protein
MSEYNIIDSIIYPETPKVTPNEVYYIYAPKAGYDTNGIASFNISHFTIVDGKVSIDTRTIADMINENLNAKIYLEGNGGTLNLEVKDYTIYYISGYNVINISAPSGADYTSHLFVSFANSGEVGFRFPEGTKIYGADPSMANAGEDWEVNIDNIGGALCMKKEVVA